MKLATIRLDGATHAALLVNDRLHVLPYPNVRATLEAHPDPVQTLEPDDSWVISADEASLAPVVADPEKIVCAGLNFRAHADEAGFELPAYPTLFGRYARSLIGPHDDIELPPVSDRADWEAEIAVVVGRAVRQATVEQARQAIAGYAVFNDVSMRDWQIRTTQFLQGKTFEACAPFGPYLVTPEEVDHAEDLALTCSVNGEEMQRSTTADMIFSPADLIAYVSQIITLVPGDVIACGTPSGVGALMDPPRYLRAGDVVTTTIEGLGTLRNTCSDATVPAEGDGNLTATPAT